mmetsp:Transcript_3560/g.7383  ORF Transcript_3560/g.7383 Transcript_3560/m.7383 type:complete len:149 (+) Transcript_3560:337-783(+)
MHGITSEINREVLKNGRKKKYIYLVRQYGRKMSERQREVVEHKEAGTGERMEPDYSLTTISVINPLFTPPPSIESTSGSPKGMTLMALALFLFLWASLMVSNDRDFHQEGGQKKDSPLSSDSPTSIVAFNPNRVFRPALSPNRKNRAV